MVKFTESDISNLIHQIDLEQTMECILDELIKYLLDRNIVATYGPTINNETEFTDEGKYQYINEEYILVIGSDKFIIQSHSSRSGSYYTDWYYSETEFTVKNANNPIFKYNFAVNGISEKLKDHIISIFEDNNIPYEIKEVKRY